MVGRYRPKAAGGQGQQLAKSGRPDNRASNRAKGSMSRRYQVPLDVEHFLLDGKWPRQL